MAEYIDKKSIESEELEHYRNSLNSHDAEMFVEFMSWIDHMSPADVIERSKVDKAIDEIKEVSFKHYFEQGEYIGEITEQWEVVKLDHVINILRRNIGE